jgi:hypothetical protein
MSDSKQTETKIELMDTKVLFQNLKDLTGLLNKSCKSGSFDLEESMHVGNIMNNLTKGLLSLDALQKLVVEKSKDHEQKELPPKKKQDHAQ